MTTITSFDSKREIFLIKNLAWYNAGSEKGPYLKLCYKKSIGFAPVHFVDCLSGATVEAKTMPFCEIIVDKGGEYIGYCINKLTLFGSNFTPQGYFERDSPDGKILKKDKDKIFSLTETTEIYPFAKTLGVQSNFRPTISTHSMYGGQVLQPDLCFNRQLITECIQETNASISMPKNIGYTSLQEKL